MIEIAKELGWQVSIPLFTVIVGAVGAMLRRNGLKWADDILRAIAPVIINVIELKKIEGGGIAGKVAKSNAVAAAVSNVPLVAKALAPMKVKEIASDIIEQSYKEHKIVQSESVQQRALEIGANINGREIGANIKAQLKKGAITLGAKKTKAGWGARTGLKFHF